MAHATAWSTAADADPCNNDRMHPHNLLLIDATATGVLGEYDHHLPFAAEDEFAIIYGPNGVGKTKFLEVIHAVSRVDGRALSVLPFESATLRFAGPRNETVIRVHPEPDGAPPGKNRRHLRRNVRFELDIDGKRPVLWSYRGDSFEDWLLENTPWRAVSDSVWEDMRDGELAPLEELQNRYSEAEADGSLLPREFQDFRGRVNSYLIETQRLRIENSAEPRRSITVHPIHRRKHSSKIAKHAEKMRHLVNDAQTEHSTITQQLDRTFPNRILQNSDHVLDAAQIRKQYDEQDTFRSRLGRIASVELAQALSLPDRDLAEWELRLLALHLDDAKAKQKPFEELLKKIELFEEIINSRLLRKKLRITAREGMHVQHHETERSIDLDSLSSGEQHEIILMFDLLFNVRPGTLVLIDEPEISLHVVWQLGFIPDVRRIAELTGFRFIVATHSPQIINDAWDRATPLGPAEAPFS